MTSWSSCFSTATCASIAGVDSAPLGTRGTRHGPSSPAASGVAREARLLEWLTVERVLYGLCLATAGALRFHDLGGQSLEHGEAAAVWPAWITATTGAGPLDSAAELPTSALVFSMHWLVFWFTGVADDAVSRWPAAAFGTALVLLPWSLRSALGRTSALILSGILAIDPLLVSLSRMAQGPIASAFCALLVLCSLARRVQRESQTTGKRPPWHIREARAAIAIGLLCVSGPQAW